MLWTKLMFEPFKEIWENRDYYGYNIRDENAPWYKQVWQTIVHGFGDLKPISISSAERSLDTGGTWSKDAVLAVLGFFPATADAIKAGYSAEAVGKIGTVPSDVFLFSKLPEADQQAILRQANKDEFERYIGHAHMKLKGPMRDELVGNQAEGPAPGPSSAPAPRPAGPVPQSAAPPPSSQPTPPPPPAQAWPPAPPPTFNDIRMR